jgi:pyruvate dehydrogenase E2 component (dihydrolipoamide acetyltransferase)
MATEVIMPKVDMDQETGTVVEWLKQEGDQVKQGESILVIETAKVAIEVESPASGILAGIQASPGEEIPIATTIAYIVQPGEDPPASPQAEKAPEKKSPAPPGEASSHPQAPAPATPVAKKMAADAALDLSAIAGSGPGGRVTKADVESRLTSRVADEADGKVYATPAARRLARERGIDLLEVQGSGPQNRIQASDVPTVPAPAAGIPAAGGRRELEIIPLVGMRKAIAERMTRSVQTAPHFILQVDVDVTRAEELRAGFNARGEVKITPTAIILKAAAWALTRHRLVNARLVENAIHLLPEVNIGVAVALEDGLIVPVVKQADQKGIGAIASEIADLSQRARAGELTADDLTGGTFTVSNLGMFGIDRFTAIINPPESAILGVGRTSNRAGDTGDGQIGLIPTLALTLSADHRVMDGVVAARFLDDLRKAIEEPGWLAF